MSIRDRVRAYLPGGNYCEGWVEVVEPRRVGVRLVNGNFWWCRPVDVKPVPISATVDVYGYDTRS